MKTIEAYQCEICRQVLDTEDKATLCEASHAKNIIVKNAYFAPGEDHPAAINIEWKGVDGKIRGGIWYK